MNEKNDFALVPRPPSALEKAEPGAKRILSGMVADTLVLVKKEHRAPTMARFRIGEYEWREPDYRQILIWAKALNLVPEEVVRRLLEGKKGEGPEWTETTFSDGRLLKLNWDFKLLPLEWFEWVDGLAMTHLSLDGWQNPAELSLRLPSLTHLSCNVPLLYKLDLSGVPRLTELWCSDNNLTKLDLSGVPMLLKLDCYFNQLTNLDLSGVPMLTELRCRSNRVTKLDLSGVSMLSKLDCGDNQITELDLSGVPRLTELWCDWNYLTKLDLFSVPVLTRLGCSMNQLTELDLSGVPMLMQLLCGLNQLTELDIRPLQNLESIDYSFGSSIRLIQRPDQHF